MQFLLILVLVSIANAESHEPLSNKEFDCRDECHRPWARIAHDEEARSTKLRRSESLLVRAVTTGDSIDVATLGRIHLLGIVAPTARSDPRTGSLGIRARDRLADLVLRHWVRLEFDDDSSGKSRAAYLWREDGLFVNAVLVRDGLARVNARRPLVRLDELQRAEREARTARRGIWERFE